MPEPAQAIDPSDENTPMLRSLSEYYRKEGIAALHFGCRFLNECRNGAATFIEAREAFVGTCYEHGVLPRLLFISLDPAHEHGEAEFRTLRAMRREEEEECEPNRLRRYPHWRETHDFAYRLLNPIAVSRGLGEINIREIHNYFAHTNSAKCKEGGFGTDQGRSVLFKNCRNFIPGEIECLEPEIIVGQGNFAHDAVRHAFPELKMWKRHPVPSLPDRYGIHEAELGGKRVLVFLTYHPRARGGLYRREKE